MGDLHLGRAFDHRHNDELWSYSGRRQREQIGKAMARAEPVDPNPEAWIAERGYCRSTSRLLIGGSDRIFEVDANEISTRSERFFKAFRATSRDEQQTLETRRHLHAETSPYVHNLSGQVAMVKTVLVALRQMSTVAGRDHPILASLFWYGIRSCRATALPLEDCRKASKGIRDEQTLCSDRL
jgi:hypothetical protein